MEALHTIIAATLGTLGPAGMEAAACALSETHRSPMDAELVAIAGASLMRQREYAAGRACLREALQRLGVDAGPIARDVDGLPVLPEGYLGSISHTKGHCLAVAARSGQVRALGVDIERTGRLSAAAVKRVVHPSESGAVERDPDLATLLFSAKEAFYKMQFPRWRTRANFQDVAFRMIRQGEGWQLGIRELGGCFPPELKEMNICCRGALLGEVAVTLCWIPVD